MIGGHSCTRTNSEERITADLGGSGKGGGVSWWRGHQKKKGRKWDSNKMWEEEEGMVGKEVQSKHQGERGRKTMQNFVNRDN